ncbi:Transcriptional activator Myb, partial [Dictyocoela roeselum]
MGKGTWTPREDIVLRKLVKERGPTGWSEIAMEMGTRNGKQCRERWNNHLDPRVKKEPFTAYEEKLVFNLHSKYGNQWSKIACMLPGRTDNAVKNFFNNCKKRGHSKTYSGLKNVCETSQVCSEYGSMFKKMVYFDHRKKNDF